LVKGAVLQASRQVQRGTQGDKPFGSKRHSK